MNKKDVNFLVTDLDDTIWDWLNMWYNSFNPYLERIAKEFNFNIADLKSDFKKLHQKYGTTESSFIIGELETLTTDQKKKISDSDSGERSIIHEYYSNKKNNLRLYDGVMETLQALRAKRTFIVGFTESNAFFTKYRIKHLNLDGMLDCIYAPVDTGLPSSFPKYYAEGYWEPEKTDFRYLPRKTKKPDSEILEIILKDFKAKKENSIYVGDKLDRDVYMAQQAEITSVWAEYGLVIDIKEYELLREVTHWTDEDVQREIDFKKNFHTKPQPDFVLKNYSELLDLFNFSTFK